MQVCIDSGSGGGVTIGGSANNSSFNVMENGDNSGEIPSNYNLETLSRGINPQPLEDREGE